MTGDKIVRFDIYCPLCEYAARGEKYDPCCECLDIGGRVDSERPINYEARDGMSAETEETALGLLREVRKIEEGLR